MFGWIESYALPLAQKANLLTEWECGIAIQHDPHRPGEVHAGQVVHNSRLG
jgi:hypothetical protein